MSARTLFSAEKIDVFYGSSQILFGVDIELAEGQTMALLGRNGAGKSTTLKAIAGLAPPRRGGARPAIAFSVVLLPAPLRPRSAIVCPSASSISTPNRIWLDP